MSMKPMDFGGEDLRRASTEIRGFIDDRRRRLTPRIAPRPAAELKLGAEILFGRTEPAWSQEKESNVVLSRSTVSSRQSDEANKSDRAKP